MVVYTFTPAVKAGLRARIGLAGPGGSGKTWTALTLARAFGGRYGVVDTDHGRAALYKPPFSFEHLVVSSFDPAELPKMVAAAAEARLDTLIVDHSSAFWSGRDGMLEQVDRATSRAGRTDKVGVGWNEMRPVERAMWEALLGYPGHVIVTMRQRTEWTFERNPDTGKTVPRRVGLAPEQRGDVDCEFDVFGVLDDAVLTVTKTRCPDLRRKVIAEPGDDLAGQILDWLADGAETVPFDALTERQWLLDPARTTDECRDRWRQLSAAGHLDAVVIDTTGVVDQPGRTVTLGELIVARSRELKPDGRRPVSLATAAAEAAA